MRLRRVGTCASKETKRLTIVEPVTGTTLVRRGVFVFVVGLWEERQIVFCSFVYKSSKIDMSGVFVG